MQRVIDRLRQARQRRRAAGQHDALLEDVGSQLGRRPLQHALNGLNQLRHGLPQRLVDLHRGDGLRPGHAGDQVAARHVHGHLVGLGNGAADAHLDLVRRALADEQVVLLAQVADDGVIEVIAADAVAGGDDHLAHGQHRDVSHSGAHVHDHGAVGLAEVDAHAQRRRHGAIQQLRVPGARVEHQVDDGALLHVIDAGGHGNHRPGPVEEVLAAGVKDELPHHGVEQAKIPHGSLPKGPDGHHVAGGAPDHAIGVAAHGEHRVGVPVQRNHRRLAQHDALAPHIDQHIGCAQIDSDVIHLRHEAAYLPSKDEFVTCHYSMIGEKRKYLFQIPAEPGRA